MPIVSRRTLLALGAGSLAATAFGAWRLGAGHPGIYLNLRGPAGYRGGATDPGEVAANYGNFSLVATDLATFVQRDVAVPFPAHGIAVSRRVPGVAILVEKWGRHCASVDFENGAVLAVDVAPNEREYIGHAAFAHDGSAVFVSEGNFTRNPDTFAAGIIGVRDPRTLALVREFASHGENPHECLLLSDAHTLAVCNQGTVNRPVPTATNIAFIDVRDGSLLERLPIDRDDICLAHMRVLPDDTVVAVSKTIADSTLSNQLYIGGRGVGLSPLSLGADRVYPTEILSLDVDTRRSRVGITNPDGDRVSFVDLRSREVIASIERPGALSIGLSRDARYWIVAGVSSSVLVIDAHSLAPAGELAPDEFEATFFTAPHATIAEPPA